MQEPSVARTAAYFGEGAHSLFGWVHCAEAAEPRDCVVVICAPIGYEYTHSHRTVRHLADRLAGRGIPAMRFDYHGIGDSAGTDLDPDRLARWQSDIRAAIAHARQASGRRSVCLVGIRLGATLAALVACESDIDLLVMWNPCVKGRAYLREAQAIAMTATRAASRADGSLESAGFVVSAETITSLLEVDLSKHRLRVGRRALLLGRDDQSPDADFLRHLFACGVEFDHERAPGWTGMMAEHQFTVIPDAALATIAGWVARNSMPSAAPSPASDQASGPALRGDQDSRDVLRIPLGGESGGPHAIEERICRFGPAGNLFGILSRASAERDRPAIVLFNAGAVHHVGPNRLYVELSRALAALGFACLRFDLEGIGDSILGSAGRENHPYPATAIADARSALECLGQRFGYTRFIAMGLCSGAHTAFHAGLEFPEADIAELVLINPLTFRWQEGMSLETANQFFDARMYRKSIRDPQRWKKLLRGDVDLRNPAAVTLRHLKTTAKAYAGALFEWLMPDRGPRLSRDLRKAFALGRQVTLFLAEGDPGLDLLMAGAFFTATRALRSGKIRLEEIADADHTFTHSRARKELVMRLGEHLKPRLAPAPARATSEAPGPPRGSAPPGPP